MAENKYKINKFDFWPMLEIIDVDTGVIYVKWMIQADQKRKKNRKEWTGKKRKEWIQDEEEEDEVKVDTEEQFKVEEFVCLI